MNHPTIVESITIAQLLHKGQFDRAGQPYWKHPVRVMMRLGENKTAVEAHAAFLHDAIEDTGVTRDQLAEVYGDEVADVVALVSRPPNVEYAYFIECIIASGNVAAMRVKLADLYDNSDEGRLTDISAGDRLLIKRKIERHYKPAIAALKSALGERAEGIIADPFDLELHIKG
jgi:(p)ppGpp synthase/HD superfamily hydrolase